MKHKFKVGDKVRRIKDSPLATIKRGDVCVVRDLHKREKRYSLYLEGFIGTWDSTLFEPVGPLVDKEFDKLWV